MVSRSYLGATTRLGIALGETLLHAVVPSGGDVPAEGDRVTIGFAREALHMMEDAG